MDGWMDGRTDGWMEGWMDGSKAGEMQGWKERRTEGRMDYDCQVLLLSTTNLYHYVSTTYILRVSTKPPLRPHRPWTCVARGLLACPIQQPRSVPRLARPRVHRAHGATTRDDHRGRLLIIGVECRPLLLSTATTLLQSTPTATTNMFPS